MTHDVICDEAELMIAANQIMDYAQFLDESIGTYIKILAKIQNKGIKDDLVCARLSELATEVKPVKTSLAKCSEDTVVKIRQYVDAVAAADNFKFSSDLQGSILTVLAQLL